MSGDIYWRNKKAFLCQKKMEDLKGMFAQMMKFQMESKQKMGKKFFNFKKKTKKES